MMTDVRGDTRIGRGWGWILAYGMLSLVLGFAAVAWPFPATLAATMVVGAFFIASGVVSIAAGFMGHGSDNRGYAIGFGIVSLIVGLVMAFEPVTGALSITLLVAIWLAVRGALELYFAVKGTRRRGLMAVLGVVNILLALYILATLGWSALTLPGFILGISFLFGGITAIAAALDHRKGASAFAV